MAKVMVIIAFVVAFAAGLTVGLELRRPSVAQVPTVDPATRPSTSGPSSRGSRSPGGWFASQLKLRPDQRVAMDKIWSEVARYGRHEMDKQRDELRKQRDEAILALIGPEGKPRYDQIQKDYREGQQKLEREMRARFEEAVRQTKALLDPEQLEKYEELLARQRPPDRDGRGPRGHGGPDGPRGPGGPERDDFEHRRGGDGGATSKPTL